MNLADRKFLVIQHNSDGRPCGWASGEDLKECEAVAALQYKTHGYNHAGCYEGEKIGVLSKLMYIGPEEGFLDIGVRWVIVISINSWGTGKTEAQALANAMKNAGQREKAKKNYSVFDVPPGTTVDAYGGWLYPSEFKSTPPLLVKRVRDGKVVGIADAE